MVDPVVVEVQLFDLSERFKNVWFQGCETVLTEAESFEEGTESREVQGRKGGVDQLKVRELEVLERREKRQKEEQEVSVKIIFFDIDTYQVYLRVRRRRKRRAHICIVGEILQHVPRLWLSVLSDGSFRFRVRICIRFEGRVRWELDDLGSCETSFPRRGSRGVGVDDDGALRSRSFQRTRRSREENRSRSRGGRLRI